MSIFGAGGGGKGGGGTPRRAKEAKDNLDSTSYAKIIELLSEGEIEGFATPSKLGLTTASGNYTNAALKDVFFNKTALLRAEADIGNPQKSDFNFQDVSFAYRLGTQNQTYVPGFDAVESEQSVNVVVAKDLPITRTISSPDVDAVRLTMSVPILQEIKDNGDIKGASVKLIVEVSYNGGGFNKVIENAISGRTSDLYQRDYLINLDGDFPVDIRVTRITGDSDSAKLSNELTWTSYTEIIYQKLRYPNSAYVALRLDAEQFSSIPSRSYRIRGIKVSIPSNATVDKENGRLIYSGVWNGTFASAAWTSDPAWILWDLITSTRYGLGDHIQAEKLDKWAFYSASRYCNELVSTGVNSLSTEPRFSCNVNIQSQEDAYKVINDMCSVFRAMPFWNAGSLTVAQDRPADAVARFSLSNVTEEGFNYETSSLKGRATIVIVSWLNLELGDIDREIVEDYEGIARYGVVTKEISAFACTSRSQARRIGEWLLYTERYETEVVSFATGLENGIILRPGSIIEIADPMKSGVRRGGRISSATTTAITVDDAADLAGITLDQAQLSVMLPNGISERQSIASIVGNVITVSEAFSTAPQNGAAWLLENSEVQPTQWRVLAVQEEDGINYGVTAVSYNSGKYSFIERGEPLEERSISVLAEPPSPPIALASEEIFYVVNGRVATKLSLSWQPVRGINEYRVRWRGDFTNWTDARVYGPIYEIEDVADGSYQIEVYSIAATQIISSSPAELTVEVQGLGVPPADPTGVSLVPIDESTAIIQWDLATDLDVLVGGEVLLRHDPQNLPTAEWGTSNAIVQAAAGGQTQKQVPLLAGTYFIAFRDQSGNRSPNPVAIPAVLPTPQPRLAVKTWAEQSESPVFNGTDINLNYDAGNGGLFLDPAVDLVGQYVYEDTLDLSAVYDVNLRRRIISSPILASGLLFDSAEGLFDSFTGDFDGSSLDLVNAVTYVRTTQGNPATANLAILLESGDNLIAEDNSLLLDEATPGGAASWSSWNEYANAIVRARGIQLKVVAKTSAASAGMVISELGATAELQQRSEAGGGSGNTGYTVTFDDPFYQTPQIMVSASNMVSGDYYAITSGSRTGFRVDFKNSANAAVTRSFSYTAIGYGREI